VTREQIERYLSSMTSMMKDTADGGKAYVHSLVAHHVLKARLLDAGTLEVSLMIQSPGTSPVQSVPVKRVFSLPKDKVSQWLDEQMAKKPKCEVCGKLLVIERRHYWRGIPKCHPRCWARKWGLKRGVQSDGMISGAELARQLRIGRTTLGRWIVTGKVRPPDKSERGILLWQHAVD